ncbi:MAG: HAD family phosphatase [Ignavibacteria bacterium]|nr:HAD family phosphatase [Ignavibacteria bacterium]
MDGVLVDSEPFYKIMNMDYFSELGINMDEEEYNGYVGMSSQKMWSRIKSNYDLSESVGELMKSEKVRMYEALRSDQISEPIEGIRELINIFSAKGFKLSVASSSSAVNIRLVLDKLNLKEHFEFIISGEEVENGKPSPDIFLKAAQYFSADPEDCFVIEDSANGVTAAKSAGMHCIGFRNSNSGEQKIDHADIIVNSFSSAEISNILNFIETE